MIIAIDFDHTICDTAHPIPGRRMGPPMEGVKDALRELRANGHTIIVHTVWGDEKGRKTIADFMNYYELPFNEITNIKPLASFYVDDKAVRFEGNWEETLKRLV